MKYRPTILAWLFASIFMVGLATTASASTLSLVPSKTSLKRGETFTLDIRIDDATDAAGCTVTLVYPASAVDLVGADPVTSSFFQTFTDSRPGADPPQIDPYMANSDTDAILMLSGAYIDTDPNTGGGGAYAGPQTLFTIQFTVEAGATFAGHDFELQQTQLCNGPAGWGTDNNNNGQYDAADGDAYEGAPILVKAYPKNSTQWSTPQLGDDFETLLDSFTVNPTATITVEESYTISGTVSYAGYQTGTMYVAAFDTSDTTYSTPIGEQNYPWSSGTTSQSFTVSAPNGTYYLRAFIDSDSSGDEPDDWEAVGNYTTAIVIAGANDSTSRNFSLTDPLDSSSGEPIYYESWKTAGGWTQIGTMNEDYDEDGYSNIQELLNVTDPTVYNAPYGTGWDPRLSATRSHGYYLPDTTFDVSINITYEGALTSLGLQDTVPAGWTLVSVGGDDAPPIHSGVGSSGVLDFGWITPPDSPVDFTYTLQVPDTATGSYDFTGEVIFSRSVHPQVNVAIPDTTAEERSYHSSDYNPEDWSINLSELLRCIQFYNVGSYHCDPQGEDGYAPGPGDQSYAPHSSDYNTQDWSLNLSELLRLIQFYNVGSYHVDPNGEDGFAPGPQP